MVKYASLVGLFDLVLVVFVGSERSVVVGWCFDYC